MIEPTDEMRMVAYRDAREWAAAHGHQQPDDRMIDDVLTAVLTIVKRDYELLPYCNNELMPGVVCKLSGDLGHREHRGTTPTGNRVTWS